MGATGRKVKMYGGHHAYEYECKTCGHTIP